MQNALCSKKIVPVALIDGQVRRSAAEAAEARR